MIRRAGDAVLEQSGEETQKIDEDFLLALRTRNAAAGGFGLGSTVWRCCLPALIYPRCDLFPLLNRSATKLFLAGHELSFDCLPSLRGW